MTEDERKSVMYTIGGARIHPFDPNPSMITIDDIAHSLGMQCRYAGHCHFFFSVAEHSVIVSELLPKHLRMEGLLHDAAEAYAQDLAAPIKHHLADYRAMIELNEAAVRARFRLPFTESPLVHEVDMLVGRYERTILTRHHDGDPDARLIVERDIKRHCLVHLNDDPYSGPPLFQHFSPLNAKIVFLKRFYNLGYDERETLS